MPGKSPAIAKGAAPKAAVKGSTGKLPPPRKPEPAKKPAGKAAIPPAKTADKKGTLPAGKAAQDKKAATAGKPATAAKPAPAKAVEAKAAKAPPAVKAAAAPAVPKVKAPKVKAPKPELTKAQIQSKAQAKARASLEKGMTAKEKASMAKPAAEVKAAAKKPQKLFFHEVGDGAERIIKRGDKTTTSPVPLDIQSRRRSGGSEESPEELVERIERELEHQHIFKRNVLRPQLCTKCGINVVSERFTIDKELGYCDDCAEILHLGETKEARKIDFHPSLMKKGEEAGAEAEPDADDDEEEEGPAPAAVPDIDV